MEKPSNHVDLQKFGTKWILIINTRKRLITFLENIMRKESLRHLILTRHFEEKWVRRKQCINYMSSFTEWMAGEILRVFKK